MTELQQHIAAQTSVAQIEHVLRQAGYHITGVDSQRPWGGFVCIDPAHHLSQHQLRQVIS